jgi:N6-adenosine-specific RNA methylase IME4
MSRKSGICGSPGCSLPSGHAVRCQELLSRYRTIVADPPWKYNEGWGIGSAASQAGRRAARTGTTFDDRRRRQMPYASMTVAEIKAIPIAALAEDDAHLYLWTTNRYLRYSYDVAEAWGFRYSQLLVWAKTPMGKGPGGTWAQNTEYVLFCRRGSLKSLQRFDSCWFNWKRMGNAHSRKPDAFLDMVEQASPGPYAELFARRARFGWDYPIGDQALGGIAA